MLLRILVFSLHCLTDPYEPFHWVLNSQGRLSFPSDFLCWIIRWEDGSSHRWSVPEKSLFIPLNTSCLLVQQMRSSLSGVSGSSRRMSLRNGVSVFWCVVPFMQCSSSVVNRPAVLLFDNYASWYDFPHDNCVWLAGVAHSSQHRLLQSSRCSAVTPRANDCWCLWAEWLLYAAHLFAL